MFGAKAEIALLEKGLAHEREFVPFDLRTLYQPKHPVVLRVNPKQQVPVLVDGELELFDSTQIFEYLEDFAPEPPLWPRDPRERARARLLELRSDEVFFPHVITLMPPDAVEEITDPAHALHAPGLGRFERAHAHLIEAERIGPVVADHVVGVHDIPAALAHLVRPAGQLDLAPLEEDLALSFLDLLVAQIREPARRGLLEDVNLLALVVLDGDDRQAAPLDLRPVRGVALRRDAVLHLAQDHALVHELLKRSERKSFRLVALTHCESNRRLVAIDSESTSQGPVIELCDPSNNSITALDYMDDKYPHIGGMCFVGRTLKVARCFDDAGVQQYDC